MPIPYTSHDRAIANAVLFQYRSPVADDPGDGIVTFQFPPKISSDNRKGTWNEGELRGVEPVAVFATSGPREFSLNWTYIVESIFGGDGVWGIDSIRENVNRIRGYFGNLKGDAVSVNTLIVDFKFPAITGRDPWTCRIKSIDVKHSDNLIGDDPEFVYPLRTDITVDLRLWTKGFREDADADEKDVVDLPLKNSPGFSDYWY